MIRCPILSGKRSVKVKGFSTICKCPDKHFHSLTHKYTLPTRVFPACLVSTSQLPNTVCPNKTERVE